MNKTLEAKCEKGLWRLEFRPSLPQDEGPCSDDWRGEIEKNLTDRISEDFSQFSRLDDDIWLLELRKKYFLKGAIRSLIAKRFVANCLNAPTSIHLLYDSSGLVDLSIIRAQFFRQGGRSRRFRCGHFCVGFKVGVALVAALVIWGSSLLRFGGGISKLEGRYPLLFAVHGEWSNRTRHIWHLFSGCRPVPPILLLGRPRGALAKIRAEILEQTGIDEEDLTLIRPYDALSGLRSLKYILCVEDGFRTITKLYDISGWVPELRELVGMSYRILLGQASRFWWNRQPVTATRVIYGHTGNADTTHLERAQQEVGARTIHLFHGVSSGHNFFGYSNVAICQNEHDAKLTRSLGGYGEVVCIKDSKPELMSSGAGFLILSNLLHPSNQYFQSYGPQGEFHLWRDVAAAVDRIGLPRAEVTWKPHPQFYALADNVQRAVLEHLRKIGFSQWEEQKSFADAAFYGVVLSTVSTTIIDLLRLGRASMVYAWPPFDQALFASRTPPDLLVSNTADIVKAYYLLRNQQDYSRLFSQFWNKLEPSVLPSIEICTEC